MNTFQIGPLVLRVAEVSVAHEGTPAAHPEVGVVRGDALGGLVTGPNGINIDIALVTWPGGSRELKTLDAHGSPPLVGYVGGRTTLFSGVVAGGDVLWMFLEAVSPQIKNPTRVSAQQVSREQLDWLWGGSFEGLLIEHGALAFGSGSELRGDASRSRNTLSVAFQPDNVVVPLLAFVVTRQLAMLKGFDKRTLVV